QRARARRVITRSGAPPTVRYCLGRRPPMRVPAPPAGTTATALVIVICTRGGSSGRLVALEPGEDHAAGRGTQYRGDGRADRLADVALAVVDHHHGAVVEIGHALTALLALLHDVDVHDLARQDDRLEGIG